MTNEATAAPSAAEHRNHSYNIVVNGRPRVVTSGEHVPIFPVDRHRRRVTERLDAVDRSLDLRVQQASTRRHSCLNRSGRAPSPTRAVGTPRPKPSRRTATSTLALSRTTHPFKPTNPSGP